MTPTEREAATARLAADLRAWELEWSHSTLPVEQLYLGFARIAIEQGVVPVWFAFKRWMDPDANGWLTYDWINPR